MATRHRHTDPYTVDRGDTAVRDDTAAPWMLIVGIILAIGLAIGAYFAFVGNDGGDGGTTINNEGDTEQVVPGDSSGGDTSGGTFGDTETDSDTGTAP